MPPSHEPAAGTQPRRRADAERSIARILDAAVDAFTGDPEASMAEIARRAGVVRATIYVHFPTRESLIEAVTVRAVSHAAGVIEAAEPGRGDAAEALRRVLVVAWRALGRFHTLVAINSSLPEPELRRRHESVLALLEPLIARGQREGVFRPGVPVAWHLSMILALIHAASAELHSARVPAAGVEAALVETVLGAVSAPTP